MGLLDRSPAEEAARDARKAIEAALDAHEERVKHAREAFEDFERQWNETVQRATAAAKAAANPRVVQRVKMGRELVLTETSLRADEHEWPLSPGVRARCEVTGNLVAVEMKNYTRTDDHRVAHLIVEGPDWSYTDQARAGIINHLDPAPFISFAAQITATAGRVQEALVRRRAALEEAQRTTAALLSDRAGFAPAVNAWVEATWGATDVAEAQRAARPLLAGVDLEDSRQHRKLAEAIEESRKKVAALGDAADATRRRVAEDDARAAAAAAQLLAEIEARTAAAEPEPEPEPPSVVFPEPPPQAVLPEPPPQAEPDVFEQIRKLGELRDAGLVTPEEFAAKKAELLARL